MAGTKAGGLKALATNKQRYGEDFYRSIGSKGGKAGHTGGFAFGDNGQKYGAIGGKLSRRGRIIRVGDPLKPTEVMILTTMAQKILNNLVEEKEILESDADERLREVYSSFYLSNWQVFFTNWACSDISMRWYTKLKDKVKEYHKLIIENKMTEDKNEEYKAVRNLCNAYEAATGRKVSMTDK